MNQLELICQTYSLCYEKIFLYKINYKKLYNLIRIKLKKKFNFKNKNKIFMHERGYSNNENTINIQKVLVSSLVFAT
jgi:hypothetical protein